MTGPMTDREMLDRLATRVDRYRRSVNEGTPFDREQDYIAMLDLLADTMVHLRRPISP
jgi:hypothetical protein